MIVKRSTLFDLPRRTEERFWLLQRPGIQTATEQLSGRFTVTVVRRANRVIESRKMTTSVPASTIRLAFSITIWATWMCRWAGSSKVLLITSHCGPRTSRSMSVTSSGRSSISSTKTYDSGIVLQHRPRHLLHQNRLAGSRRADDQPSLAETDRRQHVDDARAQLVTLVLHDDSRIGMQRCQFVKG